MKKLSLLVLLICFFNISTSGCECGAPGPASAYVKEAALVFVGKVIFTDDDGSGRFDQHTLVHFQVEESFKGLKSDVSDIWIDPGSCTSCYAEYKVGERYLVFAYGGTQLPKNTKAMSTAGEGCKVKQLPVAIDPKDPPKVYSSPECSGTRQIVRKTEASVAKEVDWLRNYKQKIEKTTN